MSVWRWIGVIFLILIIVIGWFFVRILFTPVCGVVGNYWGYVLEEGGCAELVETSCTVGLEYRFQNKEECENFYELSVCSVNADCSPDEICYSSQLCSVHPEEGVLYGSQLGDLRCHKKCQEDIDCLNVGGSCLGVEMISGDAMGFEKICLQD